MRIATAWKIADILMTALAALVIGLLFAWWGGVAVALVGLIVVLRGKTKPTAPLSRNEPVTSDEESEWYYYRYGLHHREISKD